MIKVLSLDKTFKFVSKHDEGEEPTVFHYGLLDSRIIARIRDAATSFRVDTTAPDDEVETQVSLQAMNLDYVMYAVRDITGLQDADGNDFQVSTVKRNHGGRSYKVLDPKVLDVLPPQVINELAEAIKEVNQVGADDAGN